MVLNDLQIREAFHLSFLQEFLRKFDSKLVVLKGGANLRFFFKSPRYSEDMDLDVRVASVSSVQNQVFRSLLSIAHSMKTFGVREIVPPDLERAKQTETTQRFKVHLLTQDGLDLFTKIEFSRRGLKGQTATERIHEDLLRFYRLGSIIVQHYDGLAAFEQKVSALARRSDVQARDVFDLYHLKAFIPSDLVPRLPRKDIEEAARRTADISFRQYRDAVVSYLSPEDQKIWENEELWKEMQKSVVRSLISGERAR